MRKVLTFALAVVLVMAMTVPAFAATNASVPSVFAGYRVPEAADELPQGVTFYSVYEADELPDNEKKAFADAQAALAEVAPDDMAAQYFFFVKGVKGPKQIKLKIEDVESVAVMQYEGGEWKALKDKDVKLEDGVLSVKLKNGPVAVFTK